MAHIAARSNPITKQNKASQHYRGRTICIFDYSPVFPIFVHKEVIDCLISDHKNKTGVIKCNQQVVVVKMCPQPQPVAGKLCKPLQATKLNSYMGQSFARNLWHRHPWSPCFKFEVFGLSIQHLCLASLISIYGCLPDLIIGPAPLSLPKRYQHLDLKKKTIFCLNTTSEDPKQGFVQLPQLNYGLTLISW